MAMTIPEKIQEEYKKLVDKINYHARMYYVLDNPEISDAEYDRIFDRLLQIEKEYPDIVTADSPSRRVGGEPLPQFETVTHNIRMLSLQKVTTEDEFIEFDERVKKGLGESGDIEYVVEPKLDGLAVELVYKEGMFVLGSTRRYPRRKYNSKS